MFVAVGENTSSGGCNKTSSYFSITSMTLCGKKSRYNIINHIPRHIGQPERPALELVSQLFMIKTQLV